MTCTDRHRLAVDIIIIFILILIIIIIFITIMICATNAAAAHSSAIVNATAYDDPCAHAEAHPSRADGGTDCRRSCRCYEGVQAQTRSRYSAGQKVGVPWMTILALFLTKSCTSQRDMCGKFSWAAHGIRW